jgi:hypothetical protein
VKSKCIIAAVKTTELMSFLKRGFVSFMPGTFKIWFRFYCLNAIKTRAFETLSDIVLLANKIRDLFLRRLVQGMDSLSFREIQRQNLTMRGWNGRATGAKSKDIKETIEWMLGMGWLIYNTEEDNFILSKNQE